MPNRQKVTHKATSSRTQELQVNQWIAALMLKKLGCVADVVANGSERLDALVRGRYDVVLMDCQIPVMDGFETTRAIRRHEGTRINHLPGMSRYRS